MPQCVICYSACRLSDDGRFYVCPNECSRFRVSAVERVERMCRENARGSSRLPLPDVGDVGGRLDFPVPYGEVQAYVVVAG